MLIVQDVIAGIAGGLISTVLIVIFGVIWKNTLVPWFEELVYKAVHIEGDWVGKIEYDDGATEQFAFKIVRQSYRISGIMTSLHDLKEYHIQGEFKNNILTLTYRSSLSWEIDRGCFTLVLTKNGREMHGYASYYYSDNYSVKVAPIKLDRDNLVRAAISQGNSKENDDLYSTAK